MSLPSCLLAGQLVEDRAEFGFFADQFFVVELLELGLAVSDEAVADRVAEERALRGSGGRSAGWRPCPSAIDLAITRAVGGEDAAAADLLLLEQRPLVGFLFLQRLGVEDRPVGREADQDARRGRR